MPTNMQGLKSQQDIFLRCPFKTKTKMQGYIFLIVGTFFIYDRENELCELFDYMKKLIQGISQQSEQSNSALVRVYILIFAYIGRRNKNIIKNQSLSTLQ